MGGYPGTGLGVALFAALSTPALAADGAGERAARVSAEEVAAPASAPVPPRITFGRAVDLAGRTIEPPRLPAAAATALASGTVPSSNPLLGARLTSRFGYRTHPMLGGRRFHAGVDLAAAAGTPVRAPSGGRVVSATHRGAAGNLIVIDHGGGVETRYAHLSRFAVAAGDRVTADQVIGYVGSTGRSTGPHLHYETRVSGRAVSPRLHADHAPASTIASVPGS